MSKQPQSSRILIISFEQHEQVIHAFVCPSVKSCTRYSFPARFLPIIVIGFPAEHPGFDCHALFIRQVPVDQDLYKGNLIQIPFNDLTRFFDSFVSLFSLICCSSGRALSNKSVISSKISDEKRSCVFSEQQRKMIPMLRHICVMDTEYM